MSKNRLGALVILVFSVGYGYLALDLPSIPSFEDAIDPSSLPIALSIVGVVISMLIFLIPAESPSIVTTALSAIKPKNLYRVGGLLALMVAYGTVMNPLGFLISTVFFLATGFWIMGERKPKAILIISTVTPFAFWLSLTQFLDIYLDSGIVGRLVSELLN